MLITLLTTLSVSTPSLPFPMQLERGAGGELPALVLQPGALDALEPLAQVVLSGAPLADGRRVELRLERADPDTQGLVVAIDGQAVRGGLALRGSSWAGKVEGEPESSVFFGFSPWGTRGWIYSHGEYHHVLAQPGLDGQWQHSLSRLVTETQLQALGVRANLDCGMEQLYAPGQLPQNQSVGQPHPM